MRVSVAGRALGNGRFQHHRSLPQFAEGYGVEDKRAARRRSEVQIMWHRDARSLGAVALDEPALFQEPYPFPYRRAVHAELFRKLCFCGQGVAGAEAARKNLTFEGVVDQPISRSPLYSCKFVLLHQLLLVCSRRRQVLFRLGLTCRAKMLP